MRRYVFVAQVFTLLIGFYAMCAALIAGLVALTAVDRERLLALEVRPVAHFSPPCTLTTLALHPRRWMWRH